MTTNGEQGRMATIDHGGSDNPELGKKLLLAALLNSQGSRSICLQSVHMGCIHGLALAKRLVFPGHTS